MIKGSNVLAIGLLLVGLSCSNSTEVNMENKGVVKATESVSKPVKGKKMEAEISKSTLIWKGHKIMGSHEGELDLKSGYLMGDKQNITGGEFVVDMTSIRAKSLMDGGDDHDKSELASHLRDGDFFDAPKFPTAKFVITSAKQVGAKIQIAGDMTIKGITQPITFLSTWTNGTLKANVEINRTTFNIKYGSGTFFGDLGDRAIKDNFTLDLIIPFKM